jgi:hypothetical protein
MSFVFAAAAAACAATVGELNTLARGGIQDRFPGLDLEVVAGCCPYFRHGLMTCGKG